MGQSPKLDPQQGGHKSGSAGENGKSFQDEYYICDEVPSEQPDYRVHGKASLNLDDGTGNHRNQRSVSSQAFSDPGPVEPTLQSHSTQELQKSRVFDGHERTATPQSHNRGMYVSHSVPQQEPHLPPKGQVDLSMPHVDPKDTYQSSYKNSHTGEIPPDYQLSQPPHTAFQSNISLQDGDKNRPPLQSTQQGIYVAHPVQHPEPHPPPKAQVDLSMPHVDSREQYQSSYSNYHTGELPPDGEAVSIPKTAFQSNLVLEDGDKSRPPLQSTQKGNYIAHPIPDAEPHYSPKPQVDLSMPHVDPRESYQSSYKQSHKGEAQSAEQEHEPIPRTAFKSNVVLEGGETVPHQSTQKGYYVAHPTQEVEHYQPPKGQLDLSQPHVDPKDSYQSSYNQLHQGRALSADQEAVLVPATTFVSSLVLEDAERTPTPQSTNRGNYVSHPTQAVQPIPRPKPQVDLSQPNVDNKDTFASSYQTSHTGEFVPGDDYSNIPRTTFQSSLDFEDGTGHTPRKSTQKEMFVSHATPEVEHYAPPKGQINLSQPNVDHRESFQSSYKISHTGELPTADDEIVQVPRTVFKSSIALEDGDKNRAPLSSTQKENYPLHPVQDVEHVSPAKAQISLAQPGVDPKESFQSSYSRLHTGEHPSMDDESPQIPRTTFQSSLTFEDGEKNATPRKSTQRENYPSHPTPEREHYSSPKGQITLSQPGVDPKESFQSSYSRLHTGELSAVDEDSSQIPRTAFKSSLTFEDGEKNRTPRQSTQKENYPSHPTPEKEYYSSPKPQISLAQPDVDLTDSFKSSYSTMHRGDTPFADEEVAQVARSAFQSSLDLGDNSNTPLKSTQKENYPTHQIPDRERPSRPKPQLDLSQPNVDSKDSFQTSYQRLHKGDIPADEEPAQVPRTAFQSSLAFVDGTERTPQKSTQKENYPSHPTPEREHYSSPKAQISLSQPGVDPKESFQSSYQRLHKGEAPHSVDEDTQVPRTAFQSSLTFDDGDRTPRKSTQKENYPSHPTPEKEHYSSPKPQISLAQPNVDPKDTFQSSYQRQHKGDAHTENDEPVQVPRTAFQSSIALDDGDKHRTPQRSTQKDTYPSHPVQDVEKFSPAKSQLSLSQPNVDPKESFQSSYSRLHKGDHLAEEDEVAQVPRTAFKSSLAFDDGEVARTPQKSTQKENYPSHPTPEIEHYSSPKPQISLAQPNVDTKDSFKSSYSSMHRGDTPSLDEEVTRASGSAFQSSLHLGDNSNTPLKSTQKENYPTHQIPDREQLSRPKAQVDLSQPNVDAKDSFQSSYSRLHTGEHPSVDEESPQVPRTTFKSSLTFEDGEKNATPRKSTQKENYPSHPTPEREHYSSPKGQISLAQPGVDPKESFQSSYSRLHKGGAQSTEDEPVHVPRTAFQSSLAFEDGDAHRTPHKSSQKENYPSHPVQEVEHFTPRKGQISLSQPNVDPKESFQSSYSRLHKGDHLAEEDEVVAVPRTAFKSSLAFDDGEVARTPQKSTQKENYPSHPVQDVEKFSPAKSQLSLSQPNVDPKESFQSSYSRLHKGDHLAEEDEVAPVPRTVFKSSISLDDGDKNSTPRKSTQRENYPSHPKQAVEHYTPPRAQANLLTQPNVDPKEAFQSSYSQLHKGEAPVDDTSPVIPRIAFQSSLKFEDGEKNRTPQKSTVRENYPSHPTPELQVYHAPKAQISLSQPNVDPKESFRSSYKQSHKGDALSTSDEITAVPRTTFKSSLAFDDGDKHDVPERSTHHENYPSHPIPDAQPHPPPKPQINLSQPNVDPKEVFQSSYKQQHTGEPLALQDEVSYAPRTTFQSTLTLEDLDPEPTPRKSTQHENYVSHPIPDTKPIQPPKPQISLTQPNVDPRESFQSSYKNAHKGELLPTEDEVPIVRTTFKSSVLFSDGDKHTSPIQSTQKGNYVAHTIPDSVPHRVPKAQVDLSMPEPKESPKRANKDARVVDRAAGAASPVPSRNAFQSSINFSGNELPRPTTPKSTQKSPNVGTRPDASPYLSPKPHAQSISSPSPQTPKSPSHPEDISPKPPTRRLQHQTSFSLDDGLVIEPMVSTSKRSYATAPQENDADEARQANAGRNNRSSIFGSDARISVSGSTRTQNGSPGIASSASRTASTIRESSIADKERGRATPVPTSRESYNSPPSTNVRERPRPSTALGSSTPYSLNGITSPEYNSRPRPKTPPTRRPSDFNRSSIQFASTGDLGRLTSTSRSSFSSNDSASLTLSPTPSPSRVSPTQLRSSPSLRSPTPTSPVSPYSGSKPRANASSFSLGSDNTSYHTTNRTMYNTPTSPSPTPTPIRSKSPTLPTKTSPAPSASVARNSHLRSSFSLG